MVEFYFGSCPLTSIIQQRRSLHHNVEQGRRENRALKSQLVKLQPLANIGSASSMIAHEINNLLTPLGTFAELALQHLDDQALVEKALKKAVLNCTRASKVMESMLALANGQQQPKETITIQDLVDDIFTCLCRDFSKDGINVNISIPEDLELHVVVIQIQQVLMNLILNAREAMLAQGQGTLTLRAKGGTGFVTLEVSDTGHGIAQDDLDRIFDRFFSTKDSSEHEEECFGTGLGLSFCQTVVEAHNGNLRVESKLGKGTTFKIVLPQSLC